MLLNFDLHFIIPLFRLFFKERAVFFGKRKELFFDKKESIGLFLEHYIFL